MSRKRYTLQRSEEIIGMLREAEVRLSNRARSARGYQLGLICKGLGISGHELLPMRNGVVNQHTVA